MYCRVDEKGYLHGARQLRSPNFDARPKDAQVEVLIVHCISLPAGQYEGSDVEQLFMNQLDTQKQPDYADLKGLRVSAHLFIRRDGEIVQFVPFNARAWHAGVSCCEGRERVNDFSVGIELEGTDRDGFEEAQYVSLVRASQALLAHYPLVTADRLYGHSDIAPGRKSDPGLYFDWGRYRAALRDVHMSTMVKEAGT